MSTHVNAIASSSKPHKAKDPNRKKSKKSQDAVDIPASGVNGDDAAATKRSKHGKKDKSSHATAHGHGHSHGHSSSKGPWQHQRSRMRMSIAPKFSADQLVGVRETLDALVMRYVPQLQGVLLAHWDHTFQDETVALVNECPFGIAEVEFDSIIWAPKIGQKLYGSHSLSSPSHLSLLLNKTFNISIPLQHIPLEQYEFEATDPADEEEQDSEDEDDDEADFGGFGMAKGVEEVGRWKVKSTGKLVGGGGKGIKFTVIGMQVTNQMLSLTGSLLSDPSAPPEISSLPMPAAPAHRADSPTPEPPSFDDPRPAKRPANGSTKAQAKANARDVVTNKTPVAPSASAPAPIRASDSTSASASAPAHTAAAPAIDPAYLTPREQKKLRKEEEKRKREARKERKGHAEEEEQLEATVAQGGGVSVGLSGQDAEVLAKPQIPADGAAEGSKGKKRKNEGEEGRKKKKERKE